MLHKMKLWAVTTCGRHTLVSGSKFGRLRPAAGLHWHNGLIARLEPVLREAGQVLVFLLLA